MKYLALFLLLLASGCRSALVDAVGTPEVLLTTNKRAFLAQERIGLRVENHMPDPILVRECFELEQRLGDRWEFVGHGNSCQDTHQRCEVGCNIGWGLGAIGTEHGEGTYRFAVEVLLQEDWEQQEKVVSESFTLTFSNATP